MLSMSFHLMVGLVPLLFLAVVVAVRPNPGYRRRTSGTNHPW